MMRRSLAPLRTIEHSIETFKTAQNNAFELKILIREVNTDRGTQFYSNKNEGTSEFEKYLATTPIIVKNVTFITN